MNRRLWSLAAALPFALAFAGCFATNPNPPDDWWNTDDRPVPVPGGGALTIDDLAVTPDGNLLALGYSNSGYGQAVTVMDADQNVLRTFDVGTYAMSISPLSGNRALLSDGGPGNWVIDLDTGETAAASGYDDLANYPPGYAAADSGSYDDDAGREVVNVPCESGGGSWDMDVFDADDADADGILLARVDLSGTGMTGTTDVTMGGGLVFILGYEDALAVDARTGETVIDFEDELLWDTATWAYDGTRNGLWIVSYNGGMTFRAL